MTAPSVQPTASGALTPTELAASLEGCFLVRRRPMVHGDPGIGKSQITRQVADKIYAPRYGYVVDPNGKVRDPKGKFIGNSPLARPWFREFRTATLDAVDLRGLPVVTGEKVKHSTWARPDELPTDERGGVIFFDEINRGAELTVNACFSICDTLTIGPHQIPETWVPCAAVNDKDIGARKLPSALLSRFEHLDAKTDYDDLCAYALTQDWHPVTVAFFRFRPDLIHAYDPKERVSPNPRAWGESVSPFTGLGMPKRIEHALFSGAVGPMAAGEYSAFLQMYRELPSPDAIIMDPTRAKIPDNPSVQFAITMALARLATENNIKQIVKYFDRLQPEFMVSGMTAIVKRVPSIQTMKEFTKFAIEKSVVMS